jgi:TetR/AcrR family fatty acid metabolism transcriptional regulator
MARHTKLEARKEQILTAAERIFAAKGFADATVSEVAREAGLSDATIYEYFSSKEELLFSIPLQTTRKAAQELHTHLDYIRGAVNKIRGIIYGYLSFYQNHPDYASVLMLILKQNRKFLETEAYQLIREVSRMITRVLEEGIACDEFKPDTDPYLVRAVILGTIEHSVITWLLLGRPQNLLELADPLTDIVIEGIRKDKQPKTMNFRLTLDPVDEDQRS